MLCPAKAQNASTQLVSAVNELKQQQAQIADNQTKIDSKIADLVETIRVARIFMSRAGGKHKPPKP
jgi:ABC-type transporter Mla subunit MlaD